MKNWGQYLEHWRALPEPQRERRAVLLALALTAILFVFWLVSFRFSTPWLGRSKVATPSENPARPGIIERIKAGWQTVTQ